MSVSMPVTKTLAIGDIKPYPNNPRRIPQTAVDKVAESIQSFGYHQPIVVDENNVVIVGHTRLEALKQLGVAEVPVYVSDLPAEKANEYRLIDNRTGEMSEWDHSALVMELREWETALMDSFFPEVDLEISNLTGALKDITNEDVEKAVEKAKTVRSLEPTQSTTVICPACYHSFEVKTASLPGISQMDLEVIMGTRSADDSGAGL